MFQIISEDGNARTGVLKTAHGTIQTPSFKAVATKAAVKNVTTSELTKIGQEVIISNAFLLYLRPGLRLIEQHKGLHGFMQWDKSIFTDCGGFQVLSLEQDFHLNTNDEGIEFRSPFDGQKHFLTPEKSVEIHHRLGSDVAMALDHMPLYGCTYEQAKEATLRTHNWMQQCKAHHEKLKQQGSKQLLFGIAQGSVYPDLRAESTRIINRMNFDGIAFGGLAVGEPKEKTYEMIKISCQNSQRELPRYAMGVGNPVDLINCISCGVDMFDSVFPTRNARHGHIFTSDGPINIRNAPYREDMTSLDNDCKCAVCQKYTRAYIHHLYRTGEKLGHQLTSYHNLAFIQDLMQNIRESIKANTFQEFKTKFLRRYQNET